MKSGAVKVKGSCCPDLIQPLPPLKIQVQWPA
jgi:hypothetical protein